MKYFLLFFILPVLGLVAQNIDYKMQLKNKPIVTVTDPPFLAKGDGSTNDTAAFNAAGAFCVTNGCVVYVPAKTYKIKNVLIHMGLKSMGFLMDAGTYLSCTNNDGTDCFVIDWSNTTNRAKFTMENGNILGPDTSNPRTTNSGNGLRFTSTGQTPLATIKNIEFSSQLTVLAGFYGAGKAAFWPDAAEDSHFENINISGSDIGFKAGNQFNGNTINMLRTTLTASHGYYCLDCYSNTINSLVSEGNEKEAIYDSGIGTTYNALHLEANNIGINGAGPTTGLCTMVIETTIGQIFNSPSYAGANDKVCLKKATGITTNLFNTFTGGLSSSLANGASGALDISLAPAQLFINNSSITQVTGYDCTTAFVYERTFQQFLSTCGTIGNPAYSFAMEPTSGLYRKTSGVFGFAIGGADTSLITASSFIHLTNIGLPSTTSGGLHFCTPNCNGVQPDVNLYEGTFQSITDSLIFRYKQSQTGDTVLVGLNKQGLFTSVGLGLANYAFASLPTFGFDGYVVFCTTCKSVHADAIAVDSIAVGSGAGSPVIYYGNNWRVF